ncbi:helix-hairpin-helix domain-containing protein [Fodinibius sp.]|uniref:ComEA family DNA-binding protein n=1 Tax=Fodinibius sp. TaxID=1872440 RepID=UPI002ACD5815|nr:helix-hairpin-helix domain-containing protein [Fodinibius sp.]MDZ7659950.1 helix-hairpin-helix domain-containing protein [Fodinibius sp.]
MKRRVFFWLEKLKIAPGERKAISGLLGLLVVLGGLNLALAPSVPFEDGDYLELERQFAERTAMLKAEEEKLMEQYYPASEKQIAGARIDTVSDDSTSSEGSDEPAAKVEKSDHNADKERINVNTANIEALKALPGIGSTYAKRIIKYRNENGEFESFEELKKIKGIAQKRLDKLMPFIKLKDSE